MSETYPLALQTTYRDLLDRHLRRPRPEVEGSVLEVTNSGKRYWVARRRIGASVAEHRIGPDNAETRARAAALKQQNADLGEWRRETGRLVAQLRSSGMPTPTIGTGKLINALGRAGFFDRGGVLAGTHAFGLYALELGVRLEATLAQTEDVDVAADRHVDVVADDRTSLSRSLLSLGLAQVSGPLEAHPVRWETDDRVLLDVLTPLRRSGAGAVFHDGLGVWAQALPFLEFSLQETIQAVALYREGILVRVPAPERYAIHKLIVASARQGSHRAKSGKDLMQAAVLIEALAEARPYELAAAYKDAMARGPRWRSSVAQSLSRRPDIAEVIAGVTG